MFDFSSDALDIEEYLFTQRKSLTKAQFAHQCGVSISHMSCVMHKKRRPSIGLAKRIEAISGNRVRWRDLLAYTYENDTER